MIFLLLDMVVISSVIVLFEGLIFFYFVCIGLYRELVLVYSVDLLRNSRTR